MLSWAQRFSFTEKKEEEGGGRREEGGEREERREERGEKTYGSRQCESHYHAMIGVN